MLKKKNNKKGFTLVELLVVIAIIAILVVVAVPNLFKSIYKAKCADLEADYRAIQSALLSYYADNGELPSEKLKPTDEKISKYLEGVVEKTPVGGNYEIIFKLEEGTGLGGLNPDNKIYEGKVDEINNQFKAILVLEKDNGEYPQLTKEQFITLSKDLGYGRVFVDGCNKDDGYEGWKTFNDGLTIIYIGLIENK